jgi:hypothetical protein
VEKILKQEKNLNIKKEEYIKRNLKNLGDKVMLFCKLEKDEKTFTYLKKYIHDISIKDSVKIDNDIQMKEIQIHCKLNGISVHDCNEITKWVTENGKQFRNYLNSIKIVYLVWHCLGHDWEDITWDEFCFLEDRINSVKNIILDKIR